MRITVTYDVVKAQRVRHGRCTACGIKMIKQRTFTQTVSPFNKHADGHVKTWHEVQAAVNGLADDWSPEFVHEACRMEEV